MTPTEQQRQKKHKAHTVCVREWNYYIFNSSVVCYVFIAHVHIGAMIKMGFIGLHQPELLPLRETFPSLSLCLSLCAPPRQDLGLMVVWFLG